jgi:hypothetical protein
MPHRIFPQSAVASETASPGASRALVRPRGAYRERSPWPDRERLVIHDAAGDCVLDSTIRADCVTDELLDFALAWLTHVEREQARRVHARRAAAESGRPAIFLMD